MTTKNFQQPSTAETLKANPHFTYGQAVGSSTGVAAAMRGTQFEGLRKFEWLTANDDYATGYRKGFNDKQSTL